MKAKAAAEVEMNEFDQSQAKIMNFYEWSN